MLAQAGAWLVVLVPALVGGWLVLARPRPRVAVATSLVAATWTLVGAVLVALSGPETSTPFVAGSELALRVDPLAAITLVTVTTVTQLVLAFSAVEIREGVARFHGLMLLFAASVNLTVMADTLPTLLFAWELMGATSYALIGFWWRDNVRVSAGLTAFVTTRTADLGLYVAAAAALAGGTALGLSELPGITGGWRDVAAAGVLVAALGKAAQLPFSFWLSGAMQGPSPVSALLHSAAMVAMGGYLLLRTEPLLAATSWAPNVAAWAGVTTAVLMGVVALGQRDLKQLLAASTSAQLGFVVLAAGVGSLAGGTAHLVAHASTKALLFLVAGTWLTALGSKQLSELRGAARWDRVVGWSATVGLAALAGLAPLSLWATKDAVLAEALRVSPALYAAGLVAAGLSAGYAGKVLWLLWADRAGDAVARMGAAADRLGGWGRAPLVVLAVGAAVLGVLALPPVDGELADALGGAPPQGGLAGLLVSAVLAGAVVLLVARVRLPEPGWALSWLGLERAAHRFVVRPTLALAEATARFDDRVVDRVVEVTGATVVRAADRAARVDDSSIDAVVEATGAAVVRAADRAAGADIRAVDGAVEALGAGVRRLGSLARRPQTGQLHQYYLQVVALLVLGAVLLVLVR